MTFAALYQQSLDDKTAFWGEQARRIYWHKQPDQILDESNLPFAKWFVGGETNLCYNMVDRHLEDRAEQDAFIWVSTEVNSEMTDNYPNIINAFKKLGDNVELYNDYAKSRITYQQLYKEVNYFADVCFR